MKSNLPLLVVISCNKNKHIYKILDLCLSKTNIDYFIFTGGKSFKQEKNIIQLEVDDSYEKLHLKVAAVFEYVSKFKRSIIKIDDDSFIDINKLKKIKFDFDYGGFFADNSGYSYTYHLDKVTSKKYAKPIKDMSKYDFAFGGGYFLSYKALKIFLKNYKNVDEYSYHLNGFKGREDRLVGKALINKNIIKKHIGYWLNDKIFSTLNDTIFHPIDYNKFELLFSKKLPKYYLNDIQNASI